MTRDMSAYELAVELAGRELMQGIQEWSDRRRAFLYGAFASTDSPWVDKARLAYLNMVAIPGWTASVGDQLLAELDIRENAELYAAVGGFDISEILQGLGSWWSPSATWYRSGRDLRDAVDQLPEFEQLTELLLGAGANSLTRFFDTIVSGGLRALRLRKTGIKSSRNRDVAFVVEMARVRGLLFATGPNEVGRYLSDATVSAREIGEVLQSRRRSRDHEIKADGSMSLNERSSGPRTAT